MLALMERFLSSTQMSNLPWPGSTKSEVELALSKLPADQRPNIAVYDKIEASGGRKGTVSFYKTFVLTTKSGKLALATRKALEDEAAKAKLVKDDSQEQPRPAEVRETDDEDETTAINQMLSAVRTAAKIRIQLEKIKKLKNIEFQWVRDEYDGKDSVPDDYDPTHLNIVGMGPVKKSTKVLWFKNKNAPTKAPDRMSVGEFLRWRISEDMLKREQANLGGEGGLIASAKKKEEDKKTSTVSKARNVNSSTDSSESLNAVLFYLTGDPVTENARNTEWKGNYAVDDTVYTRYKLFIQLRSDFEGTPGLLVRAKEIV